MMEKISRFIISDTYHDKRYIKETGVVLSWNHDDYHTDKVVFDNPDVQSIYVSEGERQFEAFDLFPSNQSGNRDVEFEEKLKEAIISLFERGEIEISSSLEGDQYGKVIETKVLVDGKEIYSKEDIVSVKF